MLSEGPEGDTSETAGAGRSAPADWSQPAPGELALHHRRIDFTVFDRDDHMAVVGTLQDDRPWAAVAGDVEHVHDMRLAVLVRGSDLRIVDVDVQMRRFPHPECPGIEPAFRGLIGLSVGRGYTREVQQRFGRSLGCTHLEFMARAVAPVVIQALASYRRRADGDELARGESSGDESSEGGSSGEGRPAAVSWLAGSCHIWAEGGVGEQKMSLGWRPGGMKYPAPSLVELGRRDPGMGVTDGEEDGETDKTDKEELGGGA